MRSDLRTQATGVWVPQWAPGCAFSDMMPFGFQGGGTFEIQQIRFQLLRSPIVWTVVSFLQLW
jgi:hypothetical protein